jgi:hypothetical protein
LDEIAAWLGADAVAKAAIVMAAGKRLAALRPQPTTHV